MKEFQLLKNGEVVMDHLPEYIADVYRVVIQDFPLENDWSVQEIETKENKKELTLSLDPFLYEMLEAFTCLMHPTVEDFAIHCLELGADAYLKAWKALGVALNEESSEGVPSDG